NDITLYRVSGAPTHLLINGTNLPESATFRRVEVVNLDGNIVEDLYLERLPGETALFNASTFIPPNNYFYLKTTGVDERGYPFQRITSTAINAQLPEIPEVSTRHRIVGLYGQTVVMKCYVQSLVPFVVQWFKEDIPVSVDQQFPQTAEITLAVPDVTLLSEGLFSCNASNIAGSASSTIYLDVVEPPPVIAKPNNISVTPGSVAVVTCDTSSLVDHNTTWDRLLDDGTRTGYLRSVPIKADSRVEQLDNDSLVIHRVVQDDEGWYRCIATNEGGLSRQDLYLIVQDPPKVSIVPASVNFTTGSKVNLTCVAEGYPAPFVEWRWNEAHDEDVQTGRIFVSRSSLIIQEAHQRDQGRYLCAARNPAGSDTKTVQVRYI
ncbi:hemicentin-1-like, partial [Limulus polyphemus]|uniref:Hemicentin-1-like n=1 Tax=Limulus polyphemus TaxID=6850 RepID=A0ABM1C2H7_LIMPO